MSLDAATELDDIAKRLREIMASLDPEIWIDHCETVSRAAISCMDCAKAIRDKGKASRRKAGFQYDRPNTTEPSGNSGQLPQG